MSTFPSAAAPQHGVPLRPSGPLEWLEQALSLLRAGDPRLLWSAVGAGLPVVWMALLVYYLERVEGVRALRPAFALGVAIALVHRGLRLAAVSRAYVARLRPELLAGADEPAPLSGRVVTVAIQAIGLSFWALLALLTARASPYLVALLIPLLALRGAVAPGLWARVGCAPQQGWTAFGQALDDCRGARAEMYVVELCVLLGCAALYANLLGLSSFALLLAHSMFGLEVAMLSAFSDPENPLMVLLLSSLVALVFEPLRAAISALSFVDARTRRDGADLEAAVEAAIASASRSRASQAVGVLVAGAVASTMALGCVPGPSLAQAAPDPSSLAQRDPSAPVPPDQLSPAGLEVAADADVRADVARILAAPAFREFADAGERPFTAWLEALFRRLEAWLSREASEPAGDSSLLSLPAPPVWMIVGLSLLLLLITVWVLRPRPAASAAAHSLPVSHVLQAPDRHMDTADAMAARGEYRLALRSLYLASLARLDRARLIELDPAATNWQYFRRMPAGAVRDVFRDFTRLFDHKWYGEEPTGKEDYARCRGFAEALSERMATQAAHAPDGPARAQVSGHGGQAAGDSGAAR